MSLEEKIIELEEKIRELRAENKRLRNTLFHEPESLKYYNAPKNINSLLSLIAELEFENEQLRAELLEVKIQLSKLEKETKKKFEELEKETKKKFEELEKETKKKYEELEKAGTNELMLKYAQITFDLQK